MAPHLLILKRDAHGLQGRVYLPTMLSMDADYLETSAAKDRLVSRLTQIGWIETRSQRDGQQLVRFTELGLNCLSQLGWLVKQVGWPIGLEETQALQRLCRQAERQVSAQCQLHQRGNWNS